MWNRKILSLETVITLIRSNPLFDFSTDALVQCIYSKFSIWQILCQVIYCIWFICDCHHSSQCLTWVSWLVHRANLSHCLFLLMKFYQNTAMVYSYTVHDYFYTTMTGLSCNKLSSLWNSKYLLSGLYRKKSTNALKKVLLPVFHKLRHWIWDYCGWFAYVTQGLSTGVWNPNPAGWKQIQKALFHVSGIIMVLEHVNLESGDSNISKASLLPIWVFKVNFYFINYLVFYWHGSY